MVNGTSMLSSTPSSSLFLSTAMPAAGGVSEVSAAKTAPGFANLLNGLDREGSEPAEAETSPAAAAATETAANQIEAAMASGKILPEAAETDAERETVAAKARSGSAIEATAEDAADDLADPLLALLGTAAPPSRGENRPEQPATASSTPGGAMPNLRAGKRTPVDPSPVAEAKPQAAEGKTSSSRAPGAVQISVAVSPDSSPATTERTASVDHKLARTVVEQPRIDAPLPQITQTAAVSAATADPISTVPGPQAASAPAQVFAPADIAAALDRLVAAREALMPAEAALAVEHSEFGKISIRFEQSSDGRLSAELRAADPEVQRAVTAAVATDRGSSLTSEGDGSRSLNLGNPRSASAGSEGSSGESGRTGSDREPNRQHELDRAPARQGSNDPSSGIFA